MWWRLRVFAVLLLLREFLSGMGRTNPQPKWWCTESKKKTDTVNYTCAVCSVQTGDSRHTTITPDITSHQKYTARNIPFLSASGAAAPAVLLHWATKELKSRDFAGACSALLLPHSQLGMPSSLQSHDEHTCCCSTAHPETALHLCSSTWSPVFCTRTDSPCMSSPSNTLMEGTKQWIDTAFLLPFSERLCFKDAFCSDITLLPCPSAALDVA